MPAARAGNPDVKIAGNGDTPKKKPGKIRSYDAVPPGFPAFIPPAQAVTKEMSR